MRFEHVEANQLLDVADRRDKDAYEAAIADVKARFPTVTADTIIKLATLQRQMQKRYCRFFAWRVDWTQKTRPVPGDG